MSHNYFTNLWQRTPIVRFLNGGGTPGFILNVLFLFVLTASHAPAVAQTYSGNPILPGYRADPDILLAPNGKYYIYPTSDFDNKFRAYSSSDLTNWVDEGVIFDLGPQCSWADAAGWAPTMVYRNNQYYYYYTAEHKIGVAVGNSPTGPFTDKGTPLRNCCTGDDIDPMVFIDDDGQAYLYYGSGGLNIIKLNNDMISTSGNVITTAPNDYFEAPYVFKRNGIYYLMYSVEFFTSDFYRVKYATSNSPVGPWTPRGNVSYPTSTIKGPGHNGVLKMPGCDEWYFVYHRRVAGNDERRTAIERMYFDENGSIRPVALTASGVQARPTNSVCADAQNAIVSGATYRITGKQSSKVVEVQQDSDNIAQNTWNNTDNQKWTFTDVGGGYYRITNVNSGKAMDVENFSTADGANISQHNYNGTTNQQWAIEKVDGYYRIVARNSSKVVDVVNFSTADGANISQYQWTGTDNQLWTLELLSNPAAIVSGTTYKIVARHSGQCIDVENTSTVLSDGGNISQYPYYGGQNQKWTVTDVGGGYYKFINVNSGKAMDVEDFSTAEGANISQYTYNGTPNQQWQIADVGGGYYKIIARHSGQCVDVVNFSTASSANITQYPYFGTTNQQWQFIPVSAAAGGRIAAQQPEAEAQLLLWPNPARDVFTIEYHSPIAQPARVLITDLLSRPLQQQQVQLQPGANQIELATENLPAGLVTVQLVTQTEQKIKKLQLVK